MSPYDDEEFNRMVSREFPSEHTETIDPYPYGAPAQPINPGLTKRGKAALAIGVTVLAGGGLIGWQHYTTQQAASEAKAQEIALKQQELRLEELKEMNRVNAASQKARHAADNTRQQQIDACVKANKPLVNSQPGVTYRSVVDDCQTQYGTTDSSDMQAAGSTTQTAASGDSGGINNGLLLGGAVLAAGLVVAAKKATRSNPA
ncbi:hypothetical protein [Streptomyces sp. NRRL F-5135]|uniref:hypothetical protein n=1 Tax=Streptomyces sp. NRRL F-5135 TaxID=1463858 RepID=UPI0004C6F3D5|nr:hypothetical protein [Streptomyces sp. NRRL F-5135]